jgi:hypothetical protein
VALRYRYIEGKQQMVSLLGLLRMT